jgi:hypothetical protein
LLICMQLLRLIIRVIKNLRQHPHHNLLFPDILGIKSKVVSINADHF